MEAFFKFFKQVSLDYQHYYGKNKKATLIPSLCHKFYHIRVSILEKRLVFSFSEKSFYLASICIMKPFFFSLCIMHSQKISVFLFYKIKTTVIPCTGLHVLKPKYLEIDASLNTLFGHF